MYETTIRGIGVATPPHTLPQAEARRFASHMFQGELEELERLLKIFENTEIERRALACPLEWYSAPHTFREANEIYLEVALTISEEAARAALLEAQVAASEIGAIIFVSSTGVSTPSLDASLIQRLGISRHAQRLPIWGLGCAGGVSGLARAHQIAQTLPDQPILLIATELCSLTFQAGDMSKANLVATSLFGDGAAAVVLESAPQRDPHERVMAQIPARPTLLKAQSALFHDTEYVMGWDLKDTGLMVRFDRSIPTLILEHLPTLFSETCAAWGVSVEEITHFVAHPGGARVLKAYAESMQLEPERLRHAAEVLRDLGNMSSPTVLHVLQRYLRDVPASDELGMMLAWGPGFSAEQLLFRW